MSTNPTTVKLVNSSSNAVLVIGYRGSDLSNVAIGTRIGPGNLSYTIASYNFPTQASGDDNYDWIYLLDTVTFTKYQIYMEVNDTPFNGTKKYAFIGYYDPSSSQENGNPLPFPDASSWSANWLRRATDVLSDPDASGTAKRTVPELSHPPCL